MSKRFYKTAFLLLAIPFLMIGQSNKTDSLLRVLKTSISDSTRVITLSELCWEYGFDNKTKALEYGNKGLELAKHIKNLYGEAYVYNILGVVYLRIGEYENALKLFYPCLKIREKLENKRDLAAILNKISVVLVYQGNYQKALEVSIRSLRILEPIGDTSLIITQLNCIVEIYANLNQNEKTDKYYTKIINWGSNSKDNQIITAVQKALAMREEEKGNHKKAIEHYKKIVSVYQEMNNKTDMAASLNNIGYLYRQIGDNKNGLKYYQQALEVSTEIDDVHGIAHFLSNIANIYQETKNYNKALSLQNKALNIAASNRIKPLVKDCYYRLADIYALKGNFKQAYVYQQLFSQINDTILNEENVQQMAEMQTKYESEKKEAENKTLQQQNTLKTLEIENNTKKIKIRNQTIYILAAIIIMVLVIILWQISLARIKKQKQELETEKKLQQDRERISRDLHDNVGGQLSYVLFSLEAQEEISVDKRKEKSAQLASAVRSVTGNLRETIWALNQENLMLKDISDKLKLYTRNIFSYTEIKVRFDEKIENDEVLNPAFALNLFRICQEIINNVFKHAHASELNVSMNRNEKIIISISDNGIGFLNDNLKKENFGLTNLKKRADEINATLTIKSKPNEGTKITLVV